MFGEYSGFILPSYAVTAAVIAGLAVWANLVHRARKREIADLEARGVKRRAAAGKKQP